MNNQFNLFFNLTNIIGLKLHESVDTDEMVFYFMSKSYDENWKVEQITLQSLRQFADLGILTRLKQNYIVYKISSEQNSLNQKPEMYIC